MSDIFDQVQSGQPTQAQPQPTEQGQQSAQAQLQPQPKQAQPVLSRSGGDVFDSLTGASSPASSQPSQASQASRPSNDKGFLQGVYDSTIGPVVDLGSRELEHLQSPNRSTENDAVVDAIRGIVESHKAVAHKAIEALKEHRYSEAAGYAGATALPVLGPAAAKAGEDIGRGDVAYGLGEGTGLVGSVLAPHAVAEGVKVVRAGEYPGAAALRDTFSTKAIQPKLQGGLRDIAAKASEDAGVAKASPASIRDVFEQTANNVQAKSKAIYQQLDKATGGQFQRFDDALRNINTKLREVAGLDDSAEATLQQRKSEVQAAQDEAFEQARQAGVDPKLIDDARASYRKAQALYDLDNAIKRSSQGMRPDVGDAASAAKNPELVDPKGLFRRINGLYDSGRLQDALGEQGADKLLEHTNGQLVQHMKALRNQRLLKLGAKTAAVGGGLGIARRAIE